MIAEGEAIQISTTTPTRVSGPTLSHFIHLTDIVTCEDQACGILCSGLPLLNKYDFFTSFPGIETLWITVFSPGNPCLSFLLTELERIIPHTNDHHSLHTLHNTNRHSYLILLTTWKQVKDSASSATRHSRKYWSISHMCFPHYAHLQAPSKGEVMVHELRSGTSKERVRVAMDAPRRR